MIEANRLDYLEKLNGQQRNAVCYVDGPSLVIAGAGSGKTRVLTYKIVHLLNIGIEPHRILALTFTNKAAREMKERIASVVGNKTSSRLWMGTFHSIFLRILRSHADLIGFKKDFTIYDSADSKNLIKNIIKEYGYDDKKYKPTTVAAIISNAKNALVSTKQYLIESNNARGNNREKLGILANIYKVYCERCRASEAMDFDDILYYMNLLLRDNPDILRHYQEFFKYILVDEYQDTNFAQHLIISQLGSVSGNICVVGDDAQSIYSFRGANITNILNLQQHYPNLHIFKLEQNYRSTQTIINAASSLIKHNTQQITKNVFSENDIGQPIEVVETYSDLEESFLVANKISQSKLIHHDSFDDYAILYRTNAQSRILEESLRKRNIPYRIYGGLSFYQRKEVKDAICYFRMCVNPNDDEALRRIINYPARGIGETTLKKIQSAAIIHSVSMWQVLQNPLQYELSINSGTAKKLNGFVSLIQTFITEHKYGVNAFELGQLVYNRTGMLVSLEHEHTPESISKKENLSELLNGLKDFVAMRIESGIENISMQDFLSEISLSTDQDNQDDVDEPKVTLMTVHAAKGLEFSNIFIVGVEEDLFPSIMSQDSLSEIEEERRLLYVAITRAKKYCTISYATSRFRNGQTQATRPSRFISDIDKSFLHLQCSSTIRFDNNSYVNPIQQYRSTTNFKITDESESTHLRTTSRQRVMKRINDLPQNTTKNNLNVEIGTVIVHDRFGKGKIINIDNSSGNEIIYVNFDNDNEMRKLLLKFAKFKIIK